MVNKHQFLGILFFYYLIKSVIYKVQTDQLFDVIIIGGGLAGLAASIHLSKHSFNVLLLEKNTFPHHKVCGEYISNEVLPYLNFIGLNPFNEGAINITTLHLSTHKGQVMETKLPLGGFGISRHKLDFLLYTEACKKGCIKIDTVNKIHKKENIYEVTTKNNGLFYSKSVWGAYGKRSNLDLQLNRTFVKYRTPWIGIKAHYEYHLEKNIVALHNFKGGYCGLSNVEDNKVNACYLVSHKIFSKYNSIEKFQQEEMSKNPILKHFFENSKLLFNKPLAISQISFQKKSPIAQNIPMLGDSAGLIHPLCGNGMAMALHSAKIACELFIKINPKTGLEFQKFENEYKTLWSKNFNRRLFFGKQIQKILLNENATQWAVKIATQIPIVIPTIIKQTHGKVWK